MLINQLTGNTTETRVARTGLQACVAPDADHWVFAGGAANEGALGAGNYFTLSLLDDIAAIQHTLDIPPRSIIVNGQEVFGVVFIHPYQTRALRKNYTEAQWGDIQKAAMAGAQASKNNPIFTGAIGFYGGYVIHEDSQIPWGTTAQQNGANGKARFNPVGTTNVARGVMVGAQAVAMCLGRAYDTPTRIKWTEEAQDGFNKLRVAAGMIIGMKKLRFNGADFGTIAFSTYAIPTGY